MRKACSIVLLILLTTATGYGIERVKGTHRLYLKLADDHVSESTTSPGEPIDAGANRFLVRSGETTEIWIFDTNPLLFTYEAKTVATNTADYDAALAFAKVLSTLLDRFPKSLASGDEAALTVDGLNLKQFREDIVSLQKRLDNIKTWITMSTHPDQVGELKAAVEDIPTIADRVEGAYVKAFEIAHKCFSGGTLTDSSGAVISCGDPFDFRPLLSLKRHRALLANATADLDEAAAASGVARAAATAAAAAGKRAAQAIAAAKTAKKDQKAITELETRVKDAEAAAARTEAVAKAAETARAERQNQVSALTAAMTPLVNAAAASKVAASANGTTIHEFIRDALAMESHVRSSIVTLRAFAKDAAAVNVPRKLETRPYSLQSQMVTVSVKGESKYQQFFSSEVKKYQANHVRDIQIQIEPYRSVSLRPGVGFVVGFLRNPTFSTTCRQPWVRCS